MSALSITAISIAATLGALILALGVVAVARTELAGDTSGTGISAPSATIRWDPRREFALHAGEPAPKFHFVVQCTPNYAEIGKWSVASTAAYCARHGYSLSITNAAKPEDSMPIIWSKLMGVQETLRDLPLAGTEADAPDFVIMLDADSFIYTPTVMAHSVFDSHKDLSVWLATDCSAHLGPIMWCAMNPRMLNSGYTIFRNNAEARTILNDWITSGMPGGDCYECGLRAPCDQNAWVECVSPKWRERIGVISSRWVAANHSILARQAIAIKDAHAADADRLTASKAGWLKKQWLKQKERRGLPLIPDEWARAHLTDPTGLVTQGMTAVRELCA